MKVPLKIFLTFVILIHVQFAGFSQVQSHSDSTVVKVNGPYLKSYWTDFKGVVVSPLHWSKKEVIAASSIAVASAILYTQDEKIARFSQNYRSDFGDDLNTYFFDPFGKMYYTAPLMGAFYLYGAFTHNNKPKAVAMDFVKASVYSGIIVTGIKHLGHRTRPFQTTDFNARLWDGPLAEDWNHTSFPSGHTIMTWTFASVLATHYPDKKWLGISVYALATAEGLARIYANKHWSSDVVVGAALGYAIGRFVVKHSYYNLNLTPVFGKNYSGIGLRIPLN